MRASLSVIGPLLLLIAPAAASAGRLGGGTAPDISLLRISGALILCALAALAAVAAIRTLGGRAPLRLRGAGWLGAAAGRRIEVVETRRLSAHADACLLRCEGREYLVLCGPHALTLLRERDIDAPVAPGAPA